MNPSLASLICATLATGMVYLDQSAVNIILPSLQRDLNVVMNDLQWILNLYVLFMTAPLLLFGVMGDRHGRQRLFVTGMALFGIASLACGLSNELFWLMAFRAVQGLGAGMMLAVGLAILNFHTPAEQRGKAIGTWASLSAVIIAVGPALGGGIAESIGWHGVFMINAPIALIGIVIALRWVPENRSEHPVGYSDWVSMALLLGGMGSMLFGLIEVSRNAADQTELSLLIALGFIALAAFVVRQLHHPQSLIPREVFVHRRFVAINFITLWQWIAIGGLFFVLPLQLQWTQGYSVLETGFAILPISLAVLVLSRLAGRWSDRVGPLRPMMLGIGCIAVALLWLAALENLHNYWLDLLPPTLLYGLGLGALIAPLTSVAMNALPMHYSGIASGVNNTASRLAGMFSVALFGSVLIVVVGADLETALAKIDLDAATSAAVLAQTGELVNMELSVIAHPADRDTIRALIETSSNNGFRLILAICGLICLFSLAILMWFEWRHGKANAPFWRLSNATGTE